MTYDGGKNGDGVWQTIINQMPPHRHYVELFLGSGAVMRRKRPAPGMNIGIEKDPITCAAVKSLLPTVDVITGDVLEWLTLYGKGPLPDTLIYADPPYLMETRSCQRDLYRCEFATVDEHKRLLALLDASKAMVVLSGYASSLYDALLPAPKWRKLTFIAGSHGGPREECLWMNYPGPEALHDYRFLGSDRTERQRIRRKIQRWQSKLSSLPALERNAIVAGLSIERS